MSKFTNVNQLPATGADALYRAKVLLVLAGWAVKASGDGVSSYSATGDVISSAGVLATTKAWFRIQDPAGRRELTFQRGTDNTLWRIKFSESAKFTGGTPSATATATSTDEAVLLGSGTDAAPVGASLFGADGTYRSHTIAFSDPVAGNVYSLFFFATDTSTGLARTYLFIDGLSTANLIDTSPVGVICYYKTSALAATDLSPSINAIAASTCMARAWYRYGLSSASFNYYRLSAISIYVTSGNVAVPPLTAGYGPSPNGLDGGQDIVRNVTLFRTQTDGSPQYKGVFCRLAYGTDPNRGFPDSANTTTDAYCWVNSVFVVPWQTNLEAQV